MQYEGVIITGTSGAGKSAIARKFCQKCNTFQVVQAVTTRRARADNHTGQYQYITKQQFFRLRNENKLLIEGKYRGEYYGTTHSAFRLVVDNKIPLLVLTPEYIINKHAEESKGSLSHKEDNKRLTFLTIFLDAPDNILHERLVRRGEKIDKTIERQREKDRESAKNCLRKIETVDVEKTVELIWSSWKQRDTNEAFAK